MHVHNAVMLVWACSWLAPIIFQYTEGLHFCAFINISTDSKHETLYVLWSEILHFHRWCSIKEVGIQSIWDATKHVPPCVWLWEHRGTNREQLHNPNYYRQGMSWNTIKNSNYCCMYVVISCYHLLQSYHISLIRRHGYFCFLLFLLVWLLFESSIHFIWKLADSNDGWISYMWVMRLGNIVVVRTASQFCCQPWKKEL